MNKLTVVFLTAIATAAACSAYNKLPKEEQLKEEVAQMLTDSRVTATNLEMTDYGRNRNGTKDVVVANAHFDYKSLKYSCAVIGYEEETSMGNCANSAGMTTNASFKLDKKTGKTVYTKATQKQDNSQQAQDTGKYDLDGQQF